MPQYSGARAVLRLFGWATSGFVVGLAATITLNGWGPAHVGPSAPVEQERTGSSAAAASARTFSSDAGMVLNFVKPDKTADFEAVMAKVKEALQKSDKRERRQQAESWKVMRALEPGADGSVLYVFTIDPPVKDADYTISTVLAEAFPEQVQSLFKQYAESYASGQNFLNLRLVSAPE